MDFCDLAADSVKFAKILYPKDKIITEFKDSQKVYLTFDDGPTPEVTPWVLDTLDKYQIKATFFVLGKNVAEHPELYSEIIKRGHAVGNHTFSHLKGFKVDTNTYLKDIELASKLIDTNLFRPPYGRIKRSQLKALSPKMKIILWAVISCDYEQKITPERVFEIVSKRIKPGSIIVFHDSKKAEKNMKPALEMLLTEFTEIMEFDKIVL